MVRILLLAKAYPPIVGGVESYSKYVADSYSEMGNETKVFTFGNDTGKDEGVISISSKNHLMCFLYETIFLIFNRKFDYYHCTTWKMAIPFLFFPYRKLIITVHGNEFLTGGVLFNFLMKIVFWRATSITAVSGYTMNRFIDKFPNFKNKINVSLNAPSPKPIRAFLPSEADSHAISNASDMKASRMIVYSLCRLESRKNILFALEEFHSFIKAGGDGYYLIAGAGPQLDNIQRYVEEHRLNEYVAVLGRVSEKDVAILHSVGDVFLHPQIELGGGKDVEGFGIVIADAMLSGRVVIAGQQGGPGDYINHGVNGFLVDGTVRGEIATLLKKCAEPKLRTVVESEAKSTFLNVTWKSHCVKILSDCVRIISQH